MKRTELIMHKLREFAVRPSDNCRQAIEECIFSGHEHHFSSLDEPTEPGKGKIVPFDRHESGFMDEPDSRQPGKAAHPEVLNIWKFRIVFWPTLLLILFMTAALNFFRDMANEIPERKYDPKNEKISVATDSVLIPNRKALQQPTFNRH